MNKSLRGATIVLAARCWSEAVAFAIIASFIHVLTVGREPIALWPVSVALFGLALVLVAVLRERRGERQSIGLAVGVVGAAVVWGISLPARDPDALAVLTRAIGFGIVGEAFLWRALSISRGLIRWDAVRNAAVLAVLTIVVAALLPGPIDHPALAGLGLVVVAVSAIALSLARSIEELSLARSESRGQTGTQAASGSALLLGALAIAVALLLPGVQRVLGDLAARVTPPLGDLLFLLLLPLGYLAAYLVELFRWILARLPFEFGPPRDLRPLTPAQDAELMRQIRETQPIVFGAIELLIAMVAVVIGVVLVLRLMNERRAALPAGVSLERAHEAGIGLRATLRALFPSRTHRARAPADDGSPAAALRLLYWRFLERVERSGQGWR
ncbi:MAG TPA: hypothetical protein VMJ92_04395, partial [Candidatus Limnocylindrales bacterium]|nr:hypothetical protein [Candidatus Limnocylindrales bacterium]